MDWQISYYVLWILVLLQGVALVVLFRQLGVVYLRLHPSSSAADTPAGPEIGSPIAELGNYWNGAETDVRPHTRKLLIFVVRGCSACDALLPGIDKFARVERTSTDVLVVVDDKEIQENWHHGTPVMYAPRLFDELNVRGTPYGIAVDESRKVRAKGVVNQIEHLESLLHAMETGYATESDQRKRESAGEIPQGLNEVPKRI